MVAFQLMDYENPYSLSLEVKCTYRKTTLSYNLQKYTTLPNMISL